MGSPEPTTGTRQSGDVESVDMVEDTHSSSSPFVPSLATDDSVQKSGASTPVALELFAGSCKLSKCLKFHGFLAYGVDHKKCKNRVGPCVVLDLTKGRGQAFVKDSLKSGQVACVPMAPPCGTSSRARERKWSRRLRALGVPEPKPLRSAQFPMGFPWLQGKDKLRVELAAANQCYQFVAEIFQLCYELQIPCFIENPKGSRMWDVPCIRKLFDLPGVQFTWFHSCMHGGGRDKATAILHFTPELSSLSVCCDQQHTHKKWGVSKAFGRFRFNTADEAEYPLLLCQRMARCFAQACLKRGWPVGVEPRGVPATKSVPAGWKVTGGRQPRGKAAPSLLPEDFQVTKLTVSQGQYSFLAHSVGRLRDQTIIKGRVFPKGTRIIHVQPSVSNGDPKESCGDDLLDVSLGLPIPPVTAVEMAKQCQHPFDVQALETLDSVKLAIFHQLTMGPEAMHKYRVGVLAGLKKRVRDLSETEMAMKAVMHPDVREILKGKNLSLLAELLQSIGYVDKELVDDLRGGLQITGNAKVTGTFATEFKPAQIEREDLWRSAKSAQAEVSEKVPLHMRSGQVQVESGMIDIAASVWESTMGEAQKGWLDGPLESGEVDSKVGKLWTPSRRFGIVQAGKVRNIDDMSEFAVNLAYGTPEKLDLGGLDEVVGLAALWSKACQPDGWVKTQLSDGTWMQGPLHQDFRIGSRLRLPGRCLDLKSAYKQVPLCPMDQANAVLAVWDPHQGRVRYFISKVLPFGATGAVMGFNRIARALRDLIRKLLFLPVVNYFDDFPHVDAECMAAKSQVVMEEFLDILGWQISREAKKRLPPMPQFAVLGVLVDLSRSAEGIVVIKNKPSRMAELRDTIEQVEKTSEFSPALAARVQGRLTYAEAQCSGRWLAPLLDPIKRRALLPRSVRWLSEDIRGALLQCERMLSSAPAREIDTIGREPPCIVFTDGAFENDVASCGAVIFSPRVKEVLVFGFIIPDEIVKDWRKYGAEQTNCASRHVTDCHSETTDGELAAQSQSLILHRQRWSERSYGQRHDQLSSVQEDTGRVHATRRHESFHVMV